MDNYIKLNDNNEHLSLGNLFNAIKKISINKSSAIQTEIFCNLFDIDNIADTTVGNYCTGYRAIGNKYKQIYLNYYKHYKKDKTILIKNINSLLSIIDGYLHNYQEISEINDNESLKKLTKELNIYVKNDFYVPNKLKKELYNQLKNKEYYDYLCNILFFTILEKQQPLYRKDIMRETIEEILEDTNISINHLKDYMSIQFKEGISYIPSLKKLAKNSNPYALHELGNLEYNGFIFGIPRYEEAYKYHKLAAEFNHPTSCWMVAHMIIKKKIGSLSPDDIKIAWEYLKKAISLGSISALNTIGLCYLFGHTLDGKENRQKALSYFEKAANKGYIYAYNNLGKFYEDINDYEKAFYYYEKSASEEESWACNRLGLYYYNGIFVNKDIKKAYEYFKIGAEAPYTTRIEWNIYNLVDLFYLKGNSTLGLKKDINKCLELLNEIKEFKPANLLFLYCYYELYLQDKSKENLNKVNYYLERVEKNSNNKEIKEIEAELKKIHSSIKIEL